MNAQDDERWKIEKEGRITGFINSQGDEIYSGAFKVLQRDYSQGLVFFWKDSTKGYLDINGDVIFENKYAWSNPSDSLITVSYTDNYYYLDLKGDTFLDLSGLDLPSDKEISACFDFRDGLAMVRLKDKGFEDVNEFESCLVYSESFNRYPGNWVYGFIDKQGSWVIDPLLESASSFTDGYAIVKTGKHSCFVDTNGNKSDELPYECIGESSEGIALVYENSNSFYIKKDGSRLSNESYRRAHLFSEGLAAIQVDELWGFIDTSGTVVIEPRYYTDSQFSEGLCPVSIKVDDSNYPMGRYFIEGFIDKNGNTVIPFEKHVDYGGFKNGLTKGRRFINNVDNEYTGYFELFYMDKNGVKVWSNDIEQNPK